MLVLPALADMKILAISDTIDRSLYEGFDRDRWRDVEMVISCGDLLPEYLDFLGTTLRCPVLYVRGNHDAAYPPDAYDGAVNLHGRVWQGMGLTVVGFEGSRWYNGRNLQYSERQMRWRVWRATRRLATVDIVVTHAAPLGCQDRPDQCHTGFACYRTLIERTHPKLFVHGHSHLYGTEPRTVQLGATAMVNAYGHCLLTI